jgi:uncharacterized protein YbjT (DUF2867 family)
MMTSSILVTGGTGALGHRVVERLRSTGNTIRVLSRGERMSGNGVEFVTGDLATGDGIDDAVMGSDIILHLAGSAKGDDIKTGNLVRAAKRVQPRHLVYISVVGADRVPIESRIDRAMFGYFGAKFASERIVAESGIPWTTLRATQFHDLTFKTVEGMAKMPIIPAPSGWPVQSVDAAEVADRLVELALGEPAGLVPGFGGPRVYQMADLIRSYLQATDKHRLLMPMKLPGGAARAVRDGATLTPDRAVGSRTWEEFLEARTGTSADVQLATV